MIFNITSQIFVNLETEGGAYHRGQLDTPRPQRRGARFPAGCSLGWALAPPSLSSALLRPTSPPFPLLLWLLLLPDLAISDPPGCPPLRTPSLPGQERGAVTRR